MPRCTSGLEKSIELGQRAAAAWLPGDSTRSYALNSLCGCYISRFVLFDSEHDLELAVHSFEEASVGLPPGDRDLSRTRGQLLLIFFARSGERRFIDAALLIVEKEVAATPKTHLKRASILLNGSVLLLKRYNRFKEPEDLETSVQKAVDALALSLPHDHLRSRSSKIVGHLLHTRDTEYGPLTIDHIARASEDISGKALSTLPRCLDVRLATWNCPLTPSSVRIDAARSAAALLVADSSWEHACSLLGDAVRLLPTIAPQFLNREDHEKPLSTFVGLASDTMSVALQAGYAPAHCLGLLELGRGIIMSFAIDCRSDISDLRAQHPECLNKFNALRIEIDAPLLIVQADPDQLTNKDVRRRQD